MSRDEPRRARRPDDATPAPQVEYAPPAVHNAPGPRDHPLDLLGTLVCILVVLLTIGFVCVRMFKTTFVTAGSVATPDRSMLTSANAVSNTGFAQSWAAVADYQPSGHVLLALLAIAGAGTSMVGGGMLLSRALGMNIGWRTLLATSVGIVGLGLIASATLVLGSGLDPISAVTGTGLSVHSAYTPAQVTLHAISLPLFVLGGLGPVMLIGIGRAIAGREIPTILRQTIAWTLATYIVSVIVLAPQIEKLFRDARPQAIAAAAAHALNARGLGLPVGQLADLPTSAVWTLVPLMLLGLGPAGSTGGLSCLPIALLASMAVALIRGQSPSRLAGVAVVWVTAQVVLVFVTHLILLSYQPQLQPDRTFFIAVSAVCNTGLAHDPLTVIGTAGFTLAAAMMLGKLLPLAMLAWMAALSEKTPAAQMSSTR
ncbi:MAG: hypothetical protein QM770_20820 [Tepidisphaeraceae bacterium]